jgi:ribosomal protein S20
MSTVKKNVRHNRENKISNSAYKSKLNTMRKKLNQYLKKNDFSLEMENLKREFIGFARKLVNKNILHKNKLSRLQSCFDKKCSIIKE